MLAFKVAVLGPSVYMKPNLSGFIKLIALETFLAYPLTRFGSNIKRLFVLEIVTLGSFRCLPIGAARSGIPGWFRQSSNFRVARLVGPILVINRVKIRMRLPEVIEFQVDSLDEVRHPRVIDLVDVAREVSGLAANQNDLAVKENEERSGQNQHRNGSGVQKPAHRRELRVGLVRDRTRESRVRERAHRAGAG